MPSGPLGGWKQNQVQDKEKAPRLDLIPPPRWLYKDLIQLGALTADKHSPTRRVDQCLVTRWTKKVLYVDKQFIQKYMMDEMPYD